MEIGCGSESLCAAIVEHREHFVPAPAPSSKVRVGRDGAPKRSSRADDDLELIRVVGINVCHANCDS
jgi:hypothetical protein